MQEMAQVRPGLALPRIRPEQERQSRPGEGNARVQDQVGQQRLGPDGFERREPLPTDPDVELTEQSDLQRGVRWHPRNVLHSLSIVGTLASAWLRFGHGGRLDGKAGPMALRDTLRTNAAHLLRPGEAVQVVFAAQTTSQWFALLSYWIIIIKNSYRVVVVTDQRIVVCRSGRFRVTPVNEVVHELPRTTRIGPAKGLWYQCETLGERLYIHKRFHKDIAEADALIP
jgi:hypothetical protein